MKKILRSAFVAVFALAMIGVGTSAFFSDSETSVGNTLAAGDIDLQIDNESYAIDWNIPNYDGVPNGSFVASTATSWSIRDLTVEKFFDFIDLKPGDYGEDTISVHVGSNDAWVCAAAQVTDDHDNTYVDPELEDDTTLNDDPTLADGELDEEVHFAFWVDDGDNVFESDEQVFLDGPISALGGAGQIALADSNSSILGGNTPVPGGDTFYIGKYWCFGEMSEDPVTQNGDGPAHTPLTAGTGFSCDGASVDNAAQTDVVVADLQFYAEQARNNDTFQCSQWTPDFPEQEEENELVGAALGGYDDPATCDQTVDTSNSDLQGAIDGAAEGSTICVDSSFDGEGHPETFYEVDVENLTIAGIGAAGTANLSKGLHINANGVTITGLTLDSYSFIESTENAAIYVNSAISGTTVSYNLVDAPGGAIGANAKGLITEIGNGVTPGASGLIVMHNVFDGWNQGIFYNTANHETSYNDFYNNTVGVANDGPHASSIHHNDFQGNTAEAVGVAPSADNGTTNDGILAVNFNNFTPAGAGNNVNWYGSSILGGADVDATNNWWDGEVEAARTNNTTEVDTVPAAAGAYPEN